MKIMKAYVLLIFLTMNKVYPASITKTINVSGHYAFTPLSANPTDTNDAIITIDADYVELDLQNFDYRQQVGNVVSSFNGIEIKPNHKHITVKNGIIHNITGKGIKVGSGCSKVMVDNITTISCELRAIEMIGTAGSPILDSTIKNCTAINCCEGTSGDHIFSLAFCVRSSIENCLLQQNGVSTHNLTAIKLDNCKKCICQDIIATDNLAGSDFRGIDLNTTADCIFRNCIIKNSSATTDARGCVLASSANSDGNEFVECQVVQLSGAGSVDGFLLDSTCDDNVLVCCKALLNSSTGSNASAIVHGFFIKNNNRNICEDCIAHKNLASSSTATIGAVGFEFNTCTDCQLLECQAMSHSAGGTTPVGINIDGGATCIIKDCIATRNNTGFRINPSLSIAHAFIRNQSAKNTNQFTGFIVGATSVLADISGLSALTAPWVNISVG